MILLRLGKVSKILTTDKAVQGKTRFWVLEVGRIIQKSHILEQIRTTGMARHNPSTSHLQLTLCYPSNNHPDQLHCNVQLGRWIVDNNHVDFGVIVGFLEGGVSDVAEFAAGSPSALQVAGFSGPFGIFVVTNSVAAVYWDIKSDNIPTVASDLLIYQRNIEFDFNDGIISI